MGVRKFQIEILNNPILSYFPGQVIEGHVRFTTDTECKTEGIKVKFTGKAIVEWTEDERTKSGKSHFVEEIIFNWQAYVFASVHTTGNLTEVIPPGDHAYPFTFNLPADIPTSYASSEVRVCYDIEAVLERSWKPNFKARVPFTVHGMLDLNVIPNISEAVGLRVARNLYCLCCTSGMVGFDVRLARQGYVCGENVELVIELFNESNRRIDGFSVCLIQKSIYRANVHSKGSVHSKIICAARGPSVGPGDTELWRDEILKIPALPPSHLGTTILRAVDIQYTLKMEMVLPGLSTNLVYEIPITIGTIPLRTAYRDIPGLLYRRASYPSARRSHKPSALSKMSQNHRLLSTGISETSLLEEECSSLEASYNSNYMNQRRRGSEGYEHGIFSTPSTPRKQLLQSSPSLKE